MNKFLLTVISILLTMIAGGVGYTLKKVLTIDGTVIAMKQHLVDQGWKPVARVNDPPACPPGFLPKDTIRPVKNPVVVK